MRTALSVSHVFAGDCSGTENVLLGSVARIGAMMMRRSISSLSTVPAAPRGLYLYILRVHEGPSHSLPQRRTGSSRHGQYLIQLESKVDV
jgi:hypothetical protein